MDRLAGYEDEYNYINENGEIIILPEDESTTIIENNLGSIPQMRLVLFKTSIFYFPYTYIKNPYIFIITTFFVNIGLIYPYYLI